MMSTQACSLATSTSPTPDFSQCTFEPPSSCSLMSWPVTALTSGGPPRAIEPMSFTMGTKSARPGMYAVPAAPGPTMAATSGTTPDMMTSSRKRCPVPAKIAVMSPPPEALGSMRAPAESMNHTMGMRQRSASSRMRVTLVSPMAPIEPPLTVKS